MAICIIGDGYTQNRILPMVPPLRSVSILQIALWGETADACYADTHKGNGVKRDLCDSRLTVADATRLQTATRRSIRQTPDRIDAFEWNALEHLVADAAHAEETEWIIALRSAIGDTTRSDISSRADERSWSFLGNAIVTTGLEEKQNSWTAFPVPLPRPVRHFGNSTSLSLASVGGSIL